MGRNWCCASPEKPREPWLACDVHERDDFVEHEGTYPEGTPHAQFTSIADSSRYVIASNELHRPEVFVEKCLHGMRHRCQFVDIEELALGAWVGYIRSDATKGTLVVDTA
jgi:hypothetical protein